MPRFTLGQNMSKQLITIEAKSLGTKLQALCRSCSFHSLPRAWLIECSAGYRHRRDHGTAHQGLRAQGRPEFAERRGDEGAETSH